MVHAKNMLKYIIKRILLMIPMVLLILVVTFILTTLMSQSVNLNKLGSGFIDIELIEAEKQRIGAYDPWYIRVYKYFSNFFRGDWGTSYLVAPDMPVLELFGQVWPKSIELVIIPMILIPIVSVKLGVISAKNMNNWKDTLVRVVMMIGVCIPIFWLASLLQYFVSNVLFNFTDKFLRFEVLNPNSIAYGGLYHRITGFRLLDAFLTNDQALLQDTLLHIYLPSFCLIIVSLAGITRQTRASMLEVMQKDFVRTARAKGVPDKDVINSHTLRNALIPASTAIVAAVFGLLGGSLFIEMTFNYTGMSYYMINAIRAGDYVVITGGLVISSFITLFSVLITDIVYTIIDPRIVYT